ncbi:MAG: bifunctional DNA-formamidopyrimidine glycosylase/DNA-(apurinic or apyrimidinic site) lyase [Kofleriaceae bacterium]
MLEIPVLSSGMPELPEVETVRRTLAPAIGAKILAAWDSGLGLHMARKPPRAKLKQLVGATITRLHRHGKYLLIETDTPHTLLVHLGMTGRLLIVTKGAPKAKHTHVVLELGDRELRFVDARRFGQIDVVERGHEKAHEGLALLGPDGLFEPVTGAYLFERSRAKQATLKAFVLDQSVIAGVGNIYASEALWRAKLRPTLRAHRLTFAKATVLANAIYEVFERALTKGGTSLRDFVNAEGREGTNADYLWVYGRDGEPCPRDQTKIRRSVLQGRATYYCPTCQTS